MQPDGDTVISSGSAVALSRGNLRISIMIGRRSLGSAHRTCTRWCGLISAPMGDGRDGATSGFGDDSCGHAGTGQIQPARFRGPGHNAHLLRGWRRGRGAVRDRQRLYSTAARDRFDVGELRPGHLRSRDRDRVPGCIDKITSLNWTGTRPLDKLTVHYGAFSQNDVVSTLTSVSPAGLASLQRGGRSWQYASTAQGSMGPNALGLGHLPGRTEEPDHRQLGLRAAGDTRGQRPEVPDLTDLAIDDFAFWQYAPGANALESVHFGDGLTSLTVGDDAFCVLLRRRQCRGVFASPLA